MAKSFLHCKREVGVGYSGFPTYASFPPQTPPPLTLVGVWNDTLLVAFSDNGGQPDLTYGGGRNDPLRGGKVRSYAMVAGYSCDVNAAPNLQASEFEGGYRVAAFVAGGALPPAARGTVQVRGRARA